jgi:hypothetical protein
MAQGKIFNRATLEHALGELGRRAHAEGKTIEIAIYGGSALMLTYDWRLATKDVDAVFEADRQTIRRLARDIAEENEWDPNWLNDGVKRFLSAADSSPDAKRLFRTYPSEEEPGLRVMVPTAEYLFAMKCRAMRIGGIDESEDIDDIKRLVKEIGLTSVRQAFDLVTAFYPDQLIEPNTLFRRPRSIREVSVRSKDETQEFDAALREFLDTFYANPELRQEALRERPIRIDDLHDAYLAATAEHLARCHDMVPPEWSEQYGRKLKRPYFAGGLESLKARLTVESPAAFRRRLLFVSKNALSRPRIPHDAAAP